MLQKIGCFLYYLLEDIDGEHGKRILPYNVAEKMKVWILNNMISEKGD